MSLSTTLANIRDRLRQDEFPNEQAISQGVVLRVLQILGWDTFDTNAVWPEYQTGDGRVDFALCHPPSKPAIFIEVKHVGPSREWCRPAGARICFSLRCALHSTYRRKDLELLFAR